MTSASCGVARALRDAVGTRTTPALVSAASRFVWANTQKHVRVYPQPGVGSACAQKLYLLEGRSMRRADTSATLVA